MKITRVETHVICPPLQPWNSDALVRYYGDVWSYRTIYVVQTDNGLEGLGDYEGKPRPGIDGWIRRLIGTDPLDWLAHPELPIALASGIYDLVGKHNQVPVYKLFGPKVRSRVPFETWTVSQTPSKMAEEVQQAVKKGYTWLKYHPNHFHDLVAQTEAMQAVAPPHFKVHYDLNFDNTIEHTLELARELERFPIAGAFEDPLRNEDFEGYRLLRQKCHLPLYFNHLRLLGREVMLGLTDGYILGSYTVGQVIDRAGLCEAANVPFMLKNPGGNTMVAFVAQMAAAMPMATMENNICDHVWAEDVVAPVFKVEGGTVRVPEEPGLGVKLDRDALAKWSAAKATPLPRALARIQYDGLPAIYARLPVYSLSDGFGKGASFVDGFGPGYNHPVDLDYLDDDGSREFAELWGRTAKGPVSSK